MGEQNMRFWLPLVATNAEIATTALGHVRWCSGFAQGLHCRGASEAALAEQMKVIEGNMETVESAIRGLRQALELALSPDDAKQRGEG